MKEIWKDILGYEGLYQISNIGRVKSVEREVKHVKGVNKVIEKIKAQSTKDEGYKVVSLYKDNKGTSKYIHRLVAEAFIENPFNKQTVNHIDFNKTNNIVTNLEWASYKENNRHSFDSGRHENKRYKNVTVIYENGQTVSYYSITKASKGIGCHRDTIYNYLKGENSVRLKELEVKQIIVE